MRTRDTSNKSLKQLWDIGFELLHITDFKHLRQLTQEHRLLGTISEWPVS